MHKHKHTCIIHTHKHACICAHVCTRLIHICTIHVCTRRKNRMTFERKDKGGSREWCLLNTNKFTSSSSSSDIHVLRLLLELQFRQCVYCYFNWCHHFCYISSTLVSKVTLFVGVSICVCSFWTYRHDLRPSITLGREYKRLHYYRAFQTGHCPIPFIPHYPYRFSRAEQSFYWIPMESGAKSHPKDSKEWKRVVKILIPTSFTCACQNNFF